MRLPGSRSTVLVAIALAVVTTASAGGYTWVRVHAGDTLSEIAAHHHTTVSELVALNHLPGNGGLIVAGSRLRVPARHPHAHAGSEHARHHSPSHRHHHRRHHGHRSHQSSARRVIGHYTVRPGDSVDAIAARWHVPAPRIVTANHLGSAALIRIGQHLRIPHWVHGKAAHQAGGHRHRHPAHRHRHRHHAGRHHHRHHSHGGHLHGRARHAHHWLATHHVATRAHAASLIRRVATRFHVPLTFALAIAWQESGFNQRAVSGKGAIGVMQVVPATGRFVSTYVVHRRLHLLRTRDDVVAGVGLLSVLLKDTHGDQRLAAAGYYQGLASVDAHGMFADTKQYVADVLALRQRF
jgi:LysM repeat protein